MVKHDLAYPAMLAFLPAGVLGLVLASLIAAFMSTISTHLNWGASYVVHDVYRRFFRPEASERELVNLGRALTCVLMILAALVALVLENALQAFNILLSIGAGTGLIFILRWFWWRISAATEIAGMVISFLVALFFEFGYERLGFAPLGGPTQLLFSVGVTTLLWMIVTFLAPGTDDATLKRFYILLRPSGPGWNRVRERLTHEERNGDKNAGSGSLPRALLNFVIGTFAVYFVLFGFGFIVYGRWAAGLALLVLASAAGIFLVRNLRRLEVGHE